MSDTPPSRDSGVLKPFTPGEADPLPPVEPSAVVVPAPPAEAPPPPPPPVEPPPPGPWTPPVVTPPPPEPVEAATAPAPPVPTPVPEAPASIVEPEPLAPEPDPDPTPAQLRAEPPPRTDPAPTAPPSPDSITLSRKVFFAGMAIAVLAIVGLGYLWWSSDDGDAVVDVAGDAPTSTVSESDVDTTAPAGDDGAVTALEGEVADLSAEVATLEADLAQQPIPALPGSALRRIVVAADAKFVSVGNDGVAVVGPFGGYAAIDPATNTVTATGQVASGGTRVMRTASAVWITNYTDGQIVRVDPVANQVVATFPFAGPDGIAKDGSTLVVASFDGAFVARVDPGSGEILEQVDVLGSPTAVAVTENHGIWAAIFETGEVVQIDPTTFTIVQRVIVGAGPVGLAAHEGSLWITNHEEGTVAEVDMASGEVLRSIPVGLGPTELAIVGPDVWVTVTDAGEIVQIERATGDILTRTPLGSNARGGPTGISVGNGSIWVAVQGERSVVRITPPEG